MLLGASVGGTIKNKTAEEVRELIENMTQNDYEPQARREDSQQLRMNTAMEENLLASNRLMKKQIEELSKMLEESELSHYEAKSAACKKPQENVNYLNIFVGQEQKERQQQAKHPQRVGRKRLQNLRTCKA